ncbi:BLUF domain-containing protein [Lamprobacter modestohalophilus]|uniref:BLUF domain-containing protein n=1 Tax=Lamprobacter modestohalophilus TaxID=1064514 RepID=UPI002ADEDEC8|nr:BLUF domain-containing protein [Lamprobacter modestohalophilus]MEA1049867.1 BLUF domain-containing protein [Lamprobacter modestohalophilus]
MHLTRITYCSEIIKNIGSEELSDILEVSRRNNVKDSITGVLLFNSNFFLQCLEGSREVVNRLYSRICCDKRHHNVQIVAYSEVSKRQFADWDMAYLPWTETTRKIIAQYSIGAEFNPYQMSAQSAIELLDDLGRILQKGDN